MLTLENRKDVRAALQSGYHGEKTVLSAGVWGGRTGANGPRLTEEVQAGDE